MKLLDSNKKLILDNIDFCQSAYGEADYICISGIKFNSFDSDTKNKLIHLANSYSSNIYIENKFGIQKYGKVIGSNFDDSQLKIYVKFLAHLY